MIHCTTDYLAHSISIFMMRAISTIVMIHCTTDYLAHSISIFMMRAISTIVMIPLITSLIQSHLSTGSATQMALIQNLSIKVFSVFFILKCYIQC